MKDNLISTLSEIRSQYNCFDEAEEPYYRALSEAIKKLSERADGDIISRQEAIKELEELNAISFYELNEHSREAYREIKQMLKELSPAQSEQSLEIQDILDYLDTVLHPIISPEHWNVYSELHDMISMLPSAQPERTCVNCGRTANNGGWYADGRTRCPIEEHYALPKDGFCHLWEKRNITDDDYPEKREE